MSHDTEPEEAKLVSIVEREAEEAYPVQYWDGSDIKKTFEADSDADDLKDGFDRAEAAFRDIFDVKEQ